MSIPPLSGAEQPFSDLTSQEMLHLWPLAVHARHILERLQFVSYTRAEEDAALLAAKLRERFSDEELGEMAFVGIPRGGLIVLGMLAYQLDLRPEQLHAASLPGARAICIVDDCALSGLRLQEMLDSLPREARRLAVALLYAPPALCTAALQRYPRLTACLFAHALNDDPPPIEMPFSGRLFSGTSEKVVFAWNEPEYLVQTPFAEGPQFIWRFLPPHRVAKNRLALGLPARPQSPPLWQVPEGVVYGWTGSILYLLDTRQGEVFRLDGFAADCWRAATYGSTAAALAYLQETYAQHSPQELHLRLAHNLAHFRERGLLQGNEQQA